MLPEVKQESQTFEEGATAVLSQMRSSLADLVRTAPFPVKRAADIQKAFHVANTLSWQVYRVATAANPLQMGILVPKTAALLRFISAAEKRGAPPELVREARSAVGRFDSLVERHAGDRTRFDSMVSRWAGDAAEQVDLAHRRAAFRSHSHLYGVCGATQFTCSMYHPAASGHMDAAVIIGYIDLLRLRPMTPIRIFGYKRLDPQDDSRGAPREPLVPEAVERYGAPLLPEFSSVAHDEFRQREVEPGDFVTDLLGESVGNQAAGDYVLGETARGVRIAWGDTEYHHVPVRAPVETFFLDILVHDELFGRLDPKTSLLGDMTGELGLAIHPWRTMGQAMRIPLKEQIEYAGKGSTVLHTPDIPRYESMVRSACEHLGWDIERFDIYRFQMAYPPMHSTFVTALELPDSGS